MAAISVSIRSRACRGAPCGLPGGGKPLPYKSRRIRRGAPCGLPGGGKPLPYKSRRIRRGAPCGRPGGTSPSPTKSGAAAEDQPSKSEHAGECECSHANQDSPQADHDRICGGIEPVHLLGHGHLLSKPLVRLTKKYRHPLFDSVTRRDKAVGSHVTAGAPGDRATSESLCWKERKSA